jgi:hypothetical protein
MNVREGRKLGEIVAELAQTRDQGSIVLRADTPVLPAEGFPFHAFIPRLTERTRWADIEAFVLRLGDVGCAWVNLRFSVTDDGSAVVHYEAKPGGTPLPSGSIPGLHGGFGTSQARLSPPMLTDAHALGTSLFLSRHGDSC